MNIQIVDDQDQLIGVKERSEIDDTKDIYRVAALWLTNSRGQVLMAKRAATLSKDPGTWGPAAAGTVDEGETYDENIYKEAYEEIGLDGIEFMIGPKVRVSSQRNYFCQWYFAMLDREAESFSFNREEVDAVEWVDLASLQQDLQDNPDKYNTGLERILIELKVLRESSNLE